MPLPPSVAITFFYNSSPPWRCDFSFFQHLHCQNAISALLYNSIIKALSLRSHRILSRAELRCFCKRFKRFRNDATTHLPRRRHASAAKKHKWLELALPTFRQHKNARSHRVQHRMRVICYPNAFAATHNNIQNTSERNHEDSFDVATLQKTQMAQQAQTSSRTSRANI